MNMKPYKTCDIQFGDVNQIKINNNYIKTDKDVKKKRKKNKRKKKNNKLLSQSSESCEENDDKEHK